MATPLSPYSSSSAAAAAGPPPLPTVQENIERVQEFIQENKIELALDLAETTIKVAQGEDLATLYRQLSFIYQKERKWRNVIRAADLGIPHTTDHDTLAALLFRKTSAFFNIEQWEKLHISATEGLRISTDPKWKEKFYYYRSRAYSCAGDAEKAMLDARAGLEVGEKNEIKACFQLRICAIYLSQKAYREAIDAATQGLSCSGIPENVQSNLEDHKRLATKQLQQLERRLMPPPPIARARAAAAAAGEVPPAPYKRPRTGEQ